MKLRLLHISILFTFLALTLPAQDATGSVAGVITDASGGIVPQAKVTVTNVGTRISQATLTNANGFYQVQHLPIGNYQVTVEASGFSRLDSSPAALDIKPDSANRSEIADWQSL